MFPEDTPESVIRYWAAKRRWYASGTHKTPRREEFVQMFEPPISTATLDRIRKQHPELPWPPKRTDEPPWHTSTPIILSEATREEFLNVEPGDRHILHQVRTPGLDEDGNPVVRIDEYDPKDGRIVHSFITHLHQVPALVASMVALMDAMTDGKLDGVLRICHLVRQHLFEK